MCIQNEWEKKVNWNCFQKEMIWRCSMVKNMISILIWPLAIIESFNNFLTNIGQSYSETTTKKVIKLIEQTAVARTWMVKGTSNSSDNHRKSCIYGIRFGSKTCIWNMFRFSELKIARIWYYFLRAIKAKKTIHSHTRVLKCSVINVRLNSLQRLKMLKKRKWKGSSTEIHIVIGNLNCGCVWMLLRESLKMWIVEYKKGSSCKMWSV